MKIRLPSLVTNQTQARQGSDANAGMQDKVLAYSDNSLHSAHADQANDGPPSPYPSVSRECIGPQCPDSLSMASHGVMDLGDSRRGSGTADEKAEGGCEDEGGD